MQNRPRNYSCLQVEREGQKRIRVEMSLDDRGAKNEQEQWTNLPNLNPTTPSLRFRSATTLFHSANPTTKEFDWKAHSQSEAQSNLGNTGLFIVGLVNWPGVNDNEELGVVGGLDLG